MAFPNTPTMKEYADVADVIATSPERQELTTRVARNEMFYYADRQKYLKPFEGEKAEDFKNRPKPPSNVTKRVLNTFVSNLYGKKVRRTFTDETNNAIYERILKDTDALLADGMKWQRKAELSGYVAVVPRYDPKTNKFYVNHYNSTEIIPIPEPQDPNRLRALVITYRVHDVMDKMRPMKVYREVWTPTEFAVFMDDDIMKDADGNDLQGTHNFGEIPVAIFHTDADDDLLCPRPPISDVADMNEELENFLSTWGMVFKYQAFKVVFYKNPGTDKVVASPSKWITSNNPNADIKAIDFSADLESIAKAIGFYFQMIADVGEIPAFALSGTAVAESGVALSIKFVPHQQAIDSRRVFAKAGEIKLARLFLKLSAMKSQGTPNLSEEAMNLAIDFPDLSIPLSVDERIAWNNHRLQLGTTNAVQILLEDNPEMTEDDAEEEIQNNLDMTREQRSVSSIGPDGGTNIIEDAKKKTLDKAKDNPPTQDDVE